MPELARKAKGGRNAQLNIRVAEGFDDRVKRLAKAERLTQGEFLEVILEAWEARGGGSDAGVVPVEDARAGRRNLMQFWGSDWVLIAIGKVAAERRMSVSALLDDLLSREVHRLDPHGGKFVVYVER